MTATELTTVISSALSLVLLIIVAFRLWPHQRVDLFRQNMFALRDELFDYAADGNVSFDDPAYTLLRQLMNGFIRYAHNLTPYRTLIAFLRWKLVPLQRQGGSTWTSDWYKACEQIPDQEVRRALDQFHSRAGMLVMSHLLLNPGLLIFAVPLVVIVAVLYTQWATLRTIYNDIRDTVPMSFLEEEAAHN